MYLKVFFLEYVILRTMCCHQEDVGLSIGLYQFSCINMYCYVELHRPMCGYTKQFRLIEAWHALKIAPYDYF